MFVDEPPAAGIGDFEVLYTLAASKRSCLPRFSDAIKSRERKSGRERRKIMHSCCFNNFDTSLYSPRNRALL